jgi:hypothetical protein
MSTVQLVSLGAGSPNDGVVVVGATVVVVVLVVLVVVVLVVVLVVDVLVEVLTVVETSTLDVGATVLVVTLSSRVPTHTATPMISTSTAKPAIAIRIRCWPWGSGSGGSASGVPVFSSFMTISSTAARASHQPATSEARSRLRFGSGSFTRIMVPSSGQRRPGLPQANLRLSWKCTC